MPRVTRVVVCVKALIIALPSAPSLQPPDCLALAVPAKAAAHVDYPHLVRRAGLHTDQPKIIRARRTSRQIAAA